YQSYLTTTKRALHRLATFAQQLYTTPQSGYYLATLPIGFGKTTGFLLPFVIHCIQQNPTTGIIVALERRREVKKYAREVNDNVGAPVAYPLFSHDPDACSPTCTKYHTAYTEQAKHCPILFITHEKLSRTGTDLYTAWNGGKRVVCLIDEKPAAWWGKGDIVEQDLLALRQHLQPHQHLAVRAA